MKLKWMNYDGIGLNEIWMNYEWIIFEISKNNYYINILIIFEIWMNEWWNESEGGMGKVLLFWETAAY